MLFLILFSIILLASVSAVSANELAGTDNLSNDYAIDEISSSDIDNRGLSEDTPSCLIDNNQGEIESIDKDSQKNILSQSNNQEIISDDLKSFTELNELINGNENSSVYLKNDYNYYSSYNSDRQLSMGININRTLFVYGNNHTIYGNGAKAFKVSASNVVFIDIIFKTCGSIVIENAYDGGAIYADSNSSVSALNCRFENCKGHFGAATYNVNAENCSFIGNHARNYGGAMYRGFAKNCNFSSNYADNTVGYNYAGAIAHATAINCTFINNTAQFGGAAYICNVTNCTFIANIASENGGGMYNCNATNCTLINNSAYLAGGSYWGILDNCTFINNSASGSGGAMYVSYTSSVYNCRFFNNSAASYGNAICLEYMSSLFNITDSIFDSNNGGLSGGAIYLNKSAAISNCTFINNSAFNDGGAIYSSAAVTVSNSSFVNNSVSNDGGAIYSNASLTVSNSSFVNNSASNDGGAIYLSSYGSTIRNCSFINNSAYYAGACYSTTQSSELIDCIFVENSAEAYGAVYNGKLIVCEFANNTANEYPDYSGSILPNLLLNITKSVNVTYPDAVSIAVKLSYDKKQLNGIPINVMIYANGTVLNRSIAYSGQNWRINLNAGNYTAFFYLNSSSTYANASSAIKVNGRSTSITAENAIGGRISFNSSDEKYIIVRLKDDLGNPLSGENVFIRLYESIGDALIFDLNGTTDDNGKCNISLNDLKPKLNDYDLKLMFLGNGFFEVSTASVSLKINGRHSKINATDVSVFVGDDEYLSAILFDSDTGESLANEKIHLSYCIDGINHDISYSTLADGKISVSLKDLNSTYSNFTICFEGNEEYEDAVAVVLVSISKLATVLDADNLSMYYGDECYFTGKLTDERGNAVSNIQMTVNIGSDSYPISTDGEGNFSLRIPELLAGNYSIFVSLDGNRIYRNPDGFHNLSINKYITQIDACDMRIFSNQEGELTAILLNSENGQPLSDLSLCMRLDDGDEQLSNKTDIYGQLKVHIPVLDEGNHSLNLIFGGTDKYYASNKTVSIYVGNYNVTINATDINIYCGRTAEIIATLYNESGEPLIGFDIYVSFNGNDTIKRTDLNGQVKLEISLLPVGNYPAVFYFVGNEFYNEFFKTVNVNVKRISTSLNAGNISFRYDEVGRILVQLTDEFGDNLVDEMILFKNSLIDGCSFTNSDGEAVLDLEKLLLPGDYHLNIIFEGNDKYNASSLDIKVDVLKVETDVYAPDVSVGYGANDYFTVSLRDKKGNPLANKLITVRISGSTYAETTDSNGQAIFSMNLPVKNWIANVYFDGDEIYESSSAIATISINRVNPNDSSSGGSSSGGSSNGISKINTILDVPKLTAVYNGGKYLIATLRDANGNFLSNAQILIRIGGKTHYLTTDGNGQAKLLIDLDPKIYTGTALFTGDDRHLRSSATVYVLVNKAKPKFIAKKKSFKLRVKVKKYIVTLKDNRNKAIKKAKLTLSVNGKNYKAKTNNKGKAIFKIKNLTKKGRFKAVIKYNGNKYYKAIKKAVKLTVK